MKKIIALMAFISLSTQALATCHDLEIGQSLNVYNKKSSTGLPQSYTLKRTQKKAWQAYVNLSFDSSTRNHKSIVKMKSYVKACFSQLKDYLVDERGRKVELILFEANKHTSIKTPNPVTITALPAGSRSTVSKWAEDIECGVLVHEALHVLGLVDEYYEVAMKTSGNNLAYQCRHLGPKDSIMKETRVSPYYFKNILFSGHVDTILYPECKQINEKYYNCSQNAYKSTSCNDSFSDCYDKSWVIN